MIKRMFDDSMLLTSSTVDTVPASSRRVFSQMAIDFG